MSGAIGPGDWVECIAGGRGFDTIIVGNVYRVRNFDRVTPCARCGAVGEGHAIELEGQQKGWCPTRFRPIYRPKTDFKELLTTPADQRERVDA